MKVVGIVAEYNPFHNGHKYQIEYAKNVLKADCVIVAMSGYFTQRGTIACLDKNTRAKSALLNGADLVFEIPVIFSTSSAKEYAACAITLLNSLKIVDTILFGAETDDKASFISTAEKLIEIEGKKEYEEKISKLVAKGLSYPLARQKAASEYMDLEAFSTPNNILGLEYTYFIIKNQLGLEIAPIKRLGASYDSDDLNQEYVSAKAIRNGLSKNKDIKGFVPENVYALIKSQENIIVNENDISQLLHYKLLSSLDFKDILDCNEDISNRINKLKNEYVDFESFCDLLKTKNISHTRISRILCHILLDIKHKDFEMAKDNGYISYLRLLGFSKNGAAYLKQIKENCSYPVLTGPNDMVSKYDIYSSEIFKIVMTGKDHQSHPNEFQKKFELSNI